MSNGVFCVSLFVFEVQNITNITNIDTSYYVKHFHSWTSLIWIDDPSWIMIMHFYVCQTEMLGDRLDRVQSCNIGHGTEIWCQMTCLIRFRWSWKLDKSWGGICEANAKKLTVPVLALQGSGSCLGHADFRGQNIPILLFDDNHFAIEKYCCGNQSRMQMKHLRWRDNQMSVISEAIWSQYSQKYKQEKLEYIN